MTSRSVHRGEVFLVSLGPTRGREIRKMRPCVIVSPDELNVNLKTFIVAPLTTGGIPTPFECPAGSGDGPDTSCSTRFARLIASVWCVVWGGSAPR